MPDYNTQVDPSYAPQYYNPEAGNDDRQFGFGGFGFGGHQFHHHFHHHFHHGFGGFGGFSPFFGFGFPFGFF